MSQNNTTPTHPQPTLPQAITLARAGQKEAAQAALRTIVGRQPTNQAAWMWLSAVAQTRAEAEAALAQARKIDAEHPSLPRAEQWFIQRFSKQSATKKSPVIRQPGESTPILHPPLRQGQKLLGRFNTLALGFAATAVIIGILVLLLGVASEINGAQASSTPEEEALVSLRAELVTAYRAGNLPQAIGVLEELHRLAPEAADVKMQLVEAYMQNGMALRSRGLVEDALANFEASLKLAPNHTQAQREARLAEAYLAGTAHYQAGQWPAAIKAMEQAWVEDKSYINVRDLLYSAHYNHGLARQASGELVDAKQSFEAAIALRPDLSDPRRMLAKTDYALAPETPVDIKSNVPIEDRLVLVSIAEQQMRVYEGEEQVFDFVVSTGEPGRDTAVGEFEILNKIDLAYASTWNLDMPYWMGIYWAGPLQNGIHSLPIVKHTGYKLWDGYLGQRVSYGCVILSDEDAATLYDWAEVGTKVKIISSFASWSPETE